MFYWKICSWVCLTILRIFAFWFFLNFCSVTLSLQWTPPNLSIPVLNLVDNIFQLKRRGWLRWAIYSWIHMISCIFFLRIHFIYFLWMETEKWVVHPLKRVLMIFHAIWNGERRFFFFFFLWSKALGRLIFNEWKNWRKGVLWFWIWNHVNHIPIIESRDSPMILVEFEIRTRSLGQIGAKLNGT